MAHTVRRVIAFAISATITLNSVVAIGVDALSPAEELATFQLAPGYEANLFASEADGIANPIQMRWSTDGKLYVISTPLYPQIEPGQQPDDRIIVLEDADGDGKADHSHVFADGLFLPQGLELGDGGVYVGSGPDLLHLRDTDGDGRADERQLVLSGFGNGDTHQLINNFIWGPGGGLFFCQGLHIYSRIETPWGIERLDTCGVWRLSPRRLRLDPFFGEEVPPHNPWGIAFDDWGQPILAAGNGHGIYWMTPAMIRHSDKKPLPHLWSRDKVCAAEFMGGGHFPPETENVLVTGSFMNNTVLRFRLEDDGEQFSLEELAPLIVSDHRSFRPVDMRIGPDGALYIADWYNPIIGHYQASYRHPDRDKAHGRIWRITAKDRPLLASAQLGNLSVGALIDKLRSPHHQVRYQVRRLLQAADTEEVVAKIRAWVEGLDTEEPDYDALLYRAVGVCQSHEAVVPEILDRLARASDPRARAYAARVIGRWHDRMARPLELLAKLVEDPNGRVRLEAIVACSYLARAEAMEVAALAVNHSRNIYHDYALTHAVHALGDQWRDAFAAGSIDFDGDGERIAFVLGADGSRQMLSFLRNPELAGRLSPELRRDLLARMATAGGAEELEYVLNHPEISPEMVQSVAEASRLRNTIPKGDWSDQLEKWLSGNDVSMRAAAIRLIGSWQLKTFSDRISTIAANDNEPPPVRRAALSAMASIRGKEAVGSLAEITSGSAPFPVICAAIAAWAQFDVTAAAERAAAQMIKIDNEQQAAELFAAVLPRRGGAAALATAMQDLTVSRRVAGHLRRAASAAGVGDPQLSEALDRALGLTSLHQEHDPRWIKQLAEEVENKGDAERGKEVFVSAVLNCAGCHSVYGQGGKVGPDLSSIGRSMPVDRIIEAVLWPEREIKEGYVAVTIETNDGKVFQGIKISESADSIVLLDAVTRKEQQIPWRTVEHFDAAGTLMPGGLTSGLSREQLRDLIRYLSGLDGSALRPVGDAPLPSEGGENGSASGD